MKIKKSELQRIIASEVEKVLSYSSSYRPKTYEELEKLIKNKSVYLGDIDTSLITDMAGLFQEDRRIDYNGIETWDVSNVRTMKGMFADSNFNWDISNWDVSNVEDMENMFAGNKKFNQDISNWNTSNVRNMSSMFEDSNFNKDISKWNVSKVKDMSFMFYKSKFNKNLDRWKVNIKCVKYKMFKNSPLIYNPPYWYK